MSHPSDPSVHRQRQQQFVGHVQALLNDERLAVDTTAGRRPVTGFFRDVTPGDDAVGVKQRMIELGLYDRELQRAMPVGPTLDVTLSNKTFFGGKQPVGRVRVVTLAPTAALLKGDDPPPLGKEGVHRVLAAVPPPLGRVPQTLILVSTSGFTPEARAMAGGKVGAGALVLAEANDAGGWTVTAPGDFKDLASLLDPETPEQKKERVRAAIEASPGLLMNGVAADRLAEEARVPVALAAAALRDYAAKTPGLATGTFEGTLVLYRDGTSTAGGAIGDTMPFWEKMKGLFGAGGESRDKKAARLSQERALLAQQRDRAYAEVEQVEKKEAELTKTFPSATPLAQKRIATEISQLRKRVERIQQLVSTIDKKINIIETGVHNLEMEHHLSKERLETLENVAQSSEQVDVGMATLDQLNEQADAVSVVGSELGMGAQDVLAELQAKFAAPEPAKAEPSAASADRGTPSRERATASPLPPIPGERRKVPGAAEPG
ncbi:MAG: hypothetical protein JWO31_3498 [Phycisphaerales bacterium]|nr:hypothetical protein [Phycisphaerales bacterium]